MQMQAVQFGSGVERAWREPQVVEEQRHHQLGAGEHHLMILTDEINVGQERLQYSFGSGELCKEGRDHQREVHLQHLLPQLRGGRHQLLLRHHPRVCGKRGEGADRLLV